MSAGGLWPDSEVPIEANKNLPVGCAKTNLLTTEPYSWFYGLQGVKMGLSASIRRLARVAALGKQFMRSNFLLSTAASKRKVASLPAVPRQQQLLANHRSLKLRFAGDHSNYHCGSAAVSRYIEHKLSEHGEVVADGDYDILVVNGEGSMHHDSSAFVAKMQMLEKALEAGKRALLVNTLWQSNSNRFDHVLRSLDQIIVRERLSQTELLEKHGVSSTLIPDFSYFAPVKKVAVPEAPEDNVLVTDFYSNDFRAFAAVRGGRLSRLPFIDMKTLTWDQMIATLKQNKLLITGRHHAVYAACRAEIPFVAMAGNSHKIQGIFASAGVAIPTISNIQEVEDAVRWAETNPAAYDDLFKWMRTQKDWQFNVAL